jgi:hypothetical protein
VLKLCLVARSENVLRITVSDDDTAKTATQFRYMRSKRGEKQLETMLASLETVILDSEPHPLASAMIVISTGSGVHKSRRLLPPDAAKEISTRFPEKLELPVLIDILVECASRLNGVDLAFEQLRAEFEKANDDAALPEKGVYFDYEGFEWRAALYRELARKRHPLTKQLAVIYTQRLQLPCDSYIFRREFQASRKVLHASATDLDAHEAAAIAADKDKNAQDTTVRAQAAQFLYYVASFVRHHSGRSLDGAGFRVEYDFTDQRVSAIAAFPDNCVFEVSWEYGSHMGAVVFTDEEKTFFKQYSDSIHQLLSTQTSAKDWPPPPRAETKPTK